MSPKRAGHNDDSRRVRLIRKLAQSLNGIDLSDREVGDVFELPALDADMLMAEGWALIEHTERTLDRRSGEDRRQPRPGTTETSPMGDPAHPTPGSPAARRWNDSLDVDGSVQADNQRRRAANAIREELQDSRAKTIGPAKSSEST